MKKHTVYLFVSLLLCLLVLLSGCGQKDLPTNSIPTGEAENTLSALGIPPIELPAIAGEGSVSSYTVSCSKSALKMVSAIKSATVYYDPQPVSPEKLIETLNLSQVPEEEYRSEITYANDEYSLDVDKKTGTLSLWSKKNPDPFKKAEFSDKEALEIAENFLRETGLYCEELKPNKSVGEDKIVTETETLVTGRTVHFHPKGDNGAIVFGNSRVNIHISADKRITSMNYNHVEYAQKAVLPLISAEEALEFAKTCKDPTLVQIETAGNVGQSLKIDTIKLVYYENVMDDSPSRQPVYKFQGGKDETEFAIAVSALRY